MNGDLFKITLISVIAILLAIIGGLISADGDPVSIAVAIAPFALAGLYMMKEKVWYLWILIPPLFIPFSINSYAPLFAYSVVLPFYLWNVMLRRSSLTWNSIPLLDTFIFLLFIHVAYVFLTHPFGLGINILEDYYGGKGYIMFLQALLAYLCLSSLKTTSQELGKVLQWSIALILLFTLTGPNGKDITLSRVCRSRSRNGRRYTKLLLPRHLRTGTSSAYFKILRMADDQMPLVGVVGGLGMRRNFN